MPSLLRLKRLLRPALVPAIGACLVGYFAYHAVQGDHGILARTHLRAELVQADATLAELRHEREILEYRAGLLSPERIDPDLLEERVRVMLNYAHPDEVIYFYPDEAVRPGADSARPAQ